MNNKGFAISGMLYSILILFLALLLGILTTLASQKVILDKLKNEVADKLNGEYQTHTISITSSDGGIITSDKIHASKGQTITLTAVPNASKALSVLKYNGINVNNNLTFEMPNEDVEITSEWIQKEYLFDYTGSEQSFTVPANGKYKIELWGAQGGTVPTNYSGGLGAYTSGNINLDKDTNLLLYIGGNGITGPAAVIATYSGGYNGGGIGYVSRTSCNQTAASGGGATDIRLVSNNLNSRIMVASGGGGAFSEYCSTSDNSTIIGGNGGSLIGLTATYVTKAGFSDLNPTGGTQVNGGQGLGEWTATTYTTSYVGLFGIGGNATGSSGSFSGGGGGYYGGASGKWQPGAGGSSYISGYKGCVAITSSTDQTPKTGCINGTTDITCSYHYSELIFNNAIMKAGNEVIPTHDGKSTMTGNSGNGYAKITFISR